MSESSQKPKLVRAVYNFQPTNTDELCFQKGDIITVSQVVEGGWWEGTLNNFTGWFPSNYVREISSLDARPGAKSPTHKLADAKGGLRESQASQLNHSVVLQTLISTEKAFVSDLEELLLMRLRRLETGSVLSSGEYSGLCGNLEEIAALHKTLLMALEEMTALPVNQQRIGGLFLKMAPQVQLLYQKYCSNHPKAAAIMQAKKEELSKYMEGFGVPAPGVMTLTTSLSKPFRRLERYSSLLKELERHTNEGHVDRGDAQRAISVYKDIAMTCAEIRKQKELEYDILQSEIRGWEGEEISQLGEMLLLSHVRIETESGDRKERLLLFFPGLLVILSLTPRVSGYIYEGKVSTSGCVVTTLDDPDNFGFEITGVSGGSVDRIVVFCTNAQEISKWLQFLKQYGRLAPSACTVPKPQNLQMPPAHVSVVIPLQPKFPQQSIPINSTTYSSRSAPSKLSLQLSCLRPYPPLRPSVLARDEGTRSPRSGRKLLGSNRRKPVDDAKTLEDDAVILRVIESYCTSAKARQTVNSSIFEHPPVLIAEEEKIIIDDQTVEEKTLVDTVYSLRDQVKDLKQDLLSLRKELSKEKQARKRLETNVKSIAETRESLTNTHP